MMAEVVQHYFPKLVQLHNYSSANSTKQKMYNWGTLSRELYKAWGWLRGCLALVWGCCA
jgi:hypothetical protein